jgi:hypothetical protein
MNDQELLEYCNKFLKYDPESGVLTWGKSPNGRAKVGAEAGAYDNKGYIIMTIRGYLTSGHRIIFLMSHGYTPDYVDHINQNTRDNRIVNLRACTKQQNHFNIKPTIANKSGYKGVGWRQSRGKWRSRITINQKEIHLGHFDCKHKAAGVYNEKAKELFGEFAWLNPIRES